MVVVILCRGACFIFLKSIIWQRAGIRAGTFLVGEFSCSVMGIPKIWASGKDRFRPRLSCARVGVN